MSKNQEEKEKLKAYVKEPLNELKELITHTQPEEVYNYCQLYKTEDTTNLEHDQVIVMNKGEEITNRIRTNDSWEGPKNNESC